MLFPSSDPEAQSHIENQALMTEAQRRFCQGSPHLAWFNKKARRKINKSVRLTIFKRDGGVCQLCHTPADMSDFTLDHIIPFCLGGGDEPDNLRVAHRSCNSARGSNV